MAELAQLVEEFELEPSEVELKDIGREFIGFRANIQSLAQSLVKSDTPTTAWEAHKMTRETRS
jgi:hypothetical protein